MNAYQQVISNLESRITDLEAGYSSFMSRAEDLKKELIELRFLRVSLIKATPEEPPTTEPEEAKIIRLEFGNPGRPEDLVAEYVEPPKEWEFFEWTRTTSPRVSYLAFRSGGEAKQFESSSKTWWPADMFWSAPPTPESRNWTPIPNLPPGIPMP